MVNSELDGRRSICIIRLAITASPKSTKWQCQVNYHSTIGGMPMEVSALPPIMSQIYSLIVP